MKFLLSMGHRLWLIKLSNWNDHHSGKTSSYLFECRSKSFTGLSAWFYNVDQLLISNLCTDNIWLVDWIGSILITFGNLEGTFLLRKEPKCVYVFSHSLIDVDADVLIGHCPHPVKGIEVYKNSILACSLRVFWPMTIQFKYLECANPTIAT